MSFPPKTCSAQSRPRSHTRAHTQPCGVTISSGAPLFSKSAPQSSCPSVSLSPQPLLRAPFKVSSPSPTIDRSPRDDRPLVAAPAAPWGHGPLATSASCARRSGSLCIHCSWVAAPSRAAPSRPRRPRCHGPRVTAASSPGRPLPRCHCPLLSAPAAPARQALPSHRAARVCTHRAPTCSSRPLGPRPVGFLPGAASRTREVEEVVGRRPGKAPDGTAGRKSRPLPAHLSIRTPLFPEKTRPLTH